MVLKICNFKCFQPQVYQPAQSVHALYKNTQDFFNCFLVHFRRQETINRGLLLLFSRSVVSNSCSPMDCSTPGLPVPHHLPELTQTHVHGIGDAIQPSYPLPVNRGYSLFVHGLEQNREFLSFSFPLSPLPSLSPSSSPHQRNNTECETINILLYSKSSWGRWKGQETCKNQFPRPQK